MNVFLNLFSFYGKSPYGRYPPERVIPQSATILAPVIALDSGDNKKRTIFAISIGLTILPIGDKLMTGDRSLPSFSCVLIKGVSTHPGDILLIRIFLRAQWTANACVKLTIPALAAP